MFCVKDMPLQADPEFIALCLQTDTATIGHRLQDGFHDRNIRPVLGTGTIVGTAITLCLPAQDATLIHYAAGKMRPGDVLIIDRGGNDHFACIGGTVAVALQVAGCIGAIVDGPITDPDELKEVGFPVWSRGISAITCRNQGLGGSMNVPISCGGVVVNPGDVVFADNCGVVVLREKETQENVEWAVEFSSNDRKNWERVRNGEKIADISGATELVEANMSETSQIST